MSDQNNTTGEFYTASEIARRLTFDRECQQALGGPGAGLEAGAFKFTPAPFARQQQAAKITAAQVEQVARTASIPSRLVGEPAIPRAVLWNYNALRAELGLSRQQPTAVRAEVLENDPDARPDDADSIKSVSAKTGIDQGTICALVDSGAVRDWAETREFMTSAAKPTGKKSATMQSFTSYPPVSKAEVLTVAEHGLGI